MKNKVERFLGITIIRETNAPGLRMVSAMRLPLLALAIILIAKAIGAPALALAGIQLLLAVWGITFLIHHKRNIAAFFKKMVANPWFARVLSVLLTGLIAELFMKTL